MPRPKLFGPLLRASVSSTTASMTASRAPRRTAAPPPPLPATVATCSTGGHTAVTSVAYRGAVPHRPHLLALAGLLAACDAPADARAAWLQTTLVLDNQVFLDTEPAEGQAKFARMSLGLFAYFRGTLGQYARDLGQGGGAGRTSSAYTTAETADIALIGDPHPENLGSFRRADGTLVLEFNDFDAATYGPFEFDVRRLALGFHVAALELGLEPPERHAEAAVRGYVAEIAALAAGAAAPREPGRIARHTLKKAAEDGALREELQDYTRVVAGERVLFTGDVEPGIAWTTAGHAMTVARDTVAAVTAAEAQQIAQVLADWPTTLHDPAALPPAARALKGAVRRHGAGVASYPAPRFYALLEGPSAALDDDLLLEIRRVYDPAALPGLPRLPSRPFADNGARVVALQRALQSTPDCDPLLGHASPGGAAFRVHDRSKFQRGVDLAKIAEKLAEDDWHADDVADLADDAGRLLARSHARARRQSGPVALPALAAALAPDPDGFVAETLAFVADYAPVVETDHALFLAALAAVGPSLGYSP